jgi:isopentenyl-diphosphate Delta-isomerase
LLDKNISDNVNEANSQRKQEHLDIVLNRDVDFKGVSAGFDDYYFIHQALPEINLEYVDLSIKLFDKKLAAPLIISSMVGGIDSAAELNRNLAAAAQELGLAMGLGSQRCAIDNPAAVSSYQVRDVAPDILLLANLGAVQLNYSYTVDECRRAVDMVNADGLILHLNPLQEALQPEGNTNFSGLVNKIEKVCSGLKAPVIVKEVGGGISDNVARMLSNAGVAAIDIAGAGGTSWSEVEKYRERTQAKENVAAAFASWGIPTVKSIDMVRRGAPEMTLIASGGVRNGIDVARAIALNADLAGIAAPLLRAANISVEAVITALQEFIEELKITMFCTGTTTIEELKNTPFMERKTGDLS